MFTERYSKRCQLLSLFLLVLIGFGLTSCIATTSDTRTTVPRTTEAHAPTVSSPVPLTPTSTATVDISPTEEPPEAPHTTVPTPTLTNIITTPNLINIEIPLETGNLPAYGWFSEDSQVAHFAYPEEGIMFSYDIATQSLISSTLSQNSEDEIIAQITPDLPSDAQVEAISPRYQNVLYTVPLSPPIWVETRDGLSTPLQFELYLYRDGKSTSLGAVDECMLIDLPYGLWSPLENLAAVNALSPMACAWTNWIINLESHSVTSIDEAWEEGPSRFYIAAILPNNQLLLTAFLKDEPSAILDLQTQELTVLSNRGDEIAKNLDEPVLLDLIFQPGRKATEHVTEVGFSPLNETGRQLIGTMEGRIRAKYISPDQRHVLLFSGSTDYYGLVEGQETSGVWLLSFP